MPTTKKRPAPKSGSRRVKAHVIHEWLTEDGLIKIRGWARDGYSSDEIAKKIGISASTFRSWRSKYTDIHKAIAEGLAPLTEEVEDAAYKAATGYWVQETDVEIAENPDGTTRKRTIEHNRWIPPNPALVCYILNNRKPHRWTNSPRAGVDETDPAGDGFIEALAGTAAADWEDVGDEVSADG